MVQRDDQRQPSVPHHQQVRHCCHNQHTVIQFLIIAADHYTFLLCNIYYYVYLYSEIKGMGSFGVSVKTKVPKNATIPPDATIKKILIYIIYIIF